MQDFVYVNILNEGPIIWINEMGPIFGYNMPMGIYSLMKDDPSIKMEFTTPERAKKQKIEYYKKKAEQKQQLLNSIPKNTPAPVEAVKEKEIVKEPEIIMEPATPQTVNDSFIPEEKIEIKVEEKEEPIPETINNEENVIEPDNSIGYVSEKELENSITTETAEKLNDEDSSITQSKRIITEYNDLFNNNSDTDEEDEEIDLIMADKNPTDIFNTLPAKKDEIKVYSNKELQGMTKSQLKKILAERGYIDGIYAAKYHDRVEDLIRKVKKTQSK